MISCISSSLLIHFSIFSGNPANSNPGAVYGNSCRIARLPDCQTASFPEKIKKHSSLFLHHLKKNLSLQILLIFSGSPANRQTEKLFQRTVCRIARLPDCPTASFPEKIKKHSSLFYLYIYSISIKSWTLSPSCNPSTISK